MARKRKLITGWRLLFFTILVCAVFLAVDDRFVRGAPARGFYPRSTYLMVSSWDFPRAWTTIDRGDVFERMKEDWPRPYRELELATRLTTGIRPTPERWNIWLGCRTVFAVAPEGVGITAYPGRLLRWADALRGAFGFGPGNNGIGQYRDVYYAWRDGYLIASPSRAYVAAACIDETAPLLHSDSDALLTIQWEGAHRGFVNLAPGDGMPISGQVEFTATDGARPITLPQSWPVEPAVSISARNIGDIARAWTALDAALARAEIYGPLRAVTAKAIAAWGVRPPAADAFESADHVSIVLLDVDNSGSVPIPRAALAARFADSAPNVQPLAEMFAERQTVPYEWKGSAGIMAPLLGMAFSPCVAETPYDWILTTNESVMADVAGNLSEGPACGADVDIALRASWEKLGAIAEALVLRAAEDGLVPRRSSEDIKADVIPRLTALSRLGGLTVDGVAREGTLKFSGYLAKAGESELP
ncbi:MAG: hypothetical protein HUU46_00880 [Candidatus Hydrogenedentes bacterium]|nr:hypothetical protein [Candidatus Hydrogenedentota bacterium]